MIMNSILSHYITKILSRIGYHTETERLKATWRWLTCLLYLNTVGVLLLAYANWPFLRSWSGRYSDFTHGWYSHVGLILQQNAILYAVWPILEFMGSYCQALLRRMWDRGCRCCNKFTTKQRTINGYVRVHGGPSFDLAWRYACLSNMLLLCLSFCMSIPSLMLITCLGLLLHYIVHILTITYYHTAPRLEDIDFIKGVLTTLQLGICMNLLIGWW